MKMKRIIFVVIVIVFTNSVFGQFEQNMQRYCGSQLDFSEMQKTDPKRYQNFMDFEDQLQNLIVNSRSIPSGVITIPVVVHVVYNTSTQNISDAQINSQIMTLNQDFRRFNNDAIYTPSVWTSVAVMQKLNLRWQRLIQMETQPQVLLEHQPLFQVFLTLQIM